VCLLNYSIFDETGAHPNVTIARLVNKVTNTHIHRNFSPSRFRDNVRKAGETVKKILGGEREAVAPAETQHEYEDKYTLAELTVRTGILSQLRYLEDLLNFKDDEKVRKWISDGKAITLRFESEEKCEFDREAKRDIESTTRYEKTTLFGLGGKTTETRKVITTVTDYFWTFSSTWRLVAYAGSDPKKNVVELMKRSYEREIKTVDQKKSPKPKIMIRDPDEVNVTWLFKRYDMKRKGYLFNINRSSEMCHTPRRNQDIQDALSFFGSIKLWIYQVAKYCMNNKKYFEDKTVIPASSTFPIVSAVFAFDKDTKKVFEKKDLVQFEKELNRSIRENLENCEKIFPNEKDPKAPYTTLEATFCYASKLFKLTFECICDNVNTIEIMLYNQVTSAIGKVVTENDFDEYMQYHTRKLYRSEFTPRPFSYSIRRANRFPQGEITLEVSKLENNPPLRTTVVASKRVSPESFMKFPLNASTNVRFGGDFYLHSVLLNRFGCSSGKSIQMGGFRLVARARQFSSFILLLGKIADATTFAPECAIIIKDKDDLKIPLLLETMPSAKEFQDAISSLSPEQQRFCKAYRSKQLASSVFAICTIEIKAQMEKVLNLPADSLTKELSLTNSLTDLFVQYQISPDLLSYDGDDEKVSTKVKIQRVQENNDAIRKVVDHEKAKEIEDAKKRALKEANEELKAQMIGNFPLEIDQLDEGKYSSDGDDDDFGCDDDEEEDMEECEEIDEIEEKIMDGDFQEEQDKGRNERKKDTKTEEESSKVEEGQDSNTNSSSNLLDYTKLPALLNKQFERLDIDNAIRPTKIKASDGWLLNRQNGLLSDPVNIVMYENEQLKERNAAYDLLDALTRSGVLSVECAQFHVVVAATHCFELNLMDTIVKKSWNPIEKVERSHLIMASAISGKSTEELIDNAELKRFKSFSPMLFIEDGTGK
jgi:hypothetical protein